jgi:hypothetical protein
MKTYKNSAAKCLGLACLLVGLVIAAPVIAQTRGTIAAFRVQYDIMMANYEQLFASSGNIDGQLRAQRGRAAMQAVTDEQLAKVFAKTRVPDFSTVASVAKYLVERKPIQQQKSLPFPGEPAIVNGCVGTDYTSETRYAETIANEVTQSILAAAAWACNEDILGENGSLACVPLAIAADVTAGLIDVANFCAGEVTANQVTANLERLAHIHDDLTADVAAITANINQSTAAINTNINQSTASIISNANANTTAIITNDNANKDTIVSALSALGCEIIRLLNTPEGQRASAILACSAQPGFPYKWNKVGTASLTTVR